MAMHDQSHPNVCLTRMFAPDFVECFLDHPDQLTSLSVWKNAKWVRGMIIDVQEARDLDVDWIARVHISLYPFAEEYVGVPPFPNLYIVTLMNCDFRHFNVIPCFWSSCLTALHLCGCFINGAAIEEGV